MPNRHAPKPPLITNIPLTAEAREELVEKLLAGTLPHQGDVFVPGDSFYVQGSPEERARNMVDRLGSWLGIKPGYIGLEFESGENQMANGSRYTVFVENKVCADSFILGGFIAWALVRYIVEERGQIHVPEVDAHDALLATASVWCGLGIVVSNGLSPRYGWLQKKIIPLIHGFPVVEYSYMCRRFVEQRHILPAHFQSALTPWAATRLGYSVSKHPFYMVNNAIQIIKMRNLKILGIGWVICVVIFIVAFTLTQRVHPSSAQARSANQRVTELGKAKQNCYQKLAYDKQYSDVSDIQTLRVLNAEELQCQSLQNQYDDALSAYQKLINQ